MIVFSKKRVFSALVFAAIAAAPLSGSAAPAPAFAQNSGWAAEVRAYVDLNAAPAVVIAEAASDPFSNLVSKRARSGASGVVRFVSTEGDRVALFEDGDPARMKFLCRGGDPRLECAFGAGAEEVFLVQGVRGPRGDLFYKSRSGVTLLRVAPHGGASLAWPGLVSPVGAVRAAAEPGDNLALAPQTSGFAARRASAASAALVARVGRPIPFDIGASGSGGGGVARFVGRQAESGVAYAAAPTMEVESEASVLADAVARVASGIAAVARDDTGVKAVSARISSVRFVEAARPGLSLDGKTLIVSFDPGSGVAGRPSSDEVARFLESVL